MLVVCVKLMFFVLHNNEEFCFILDGLYPPCTLFVCILDGAP